MYSKIYNLKFTSIAEAKIGVSFLSEEIGGAIMESNIASLSILLDKEGLVVVTIRFDTLEDMNQFVKRKFEVFDSLKMSFSLRYWERSAVAVYTFDREASSVT